MESKDEIRETAEQVLAKISGSASDLFWLGSQFERITILEKYRLLIQEKDLAGDPIAAAVLGWAYERLADEN